MVTNRTRTKKAVRPIPAPVASLFYGMADEGPGVLSVLSVSASGLVRMRHDVTVPGRVRVRRDFSVADRGLPGMPLVEVRVRGLPHVFVSALPSAVMAVALR